MPYDPLSFPGQNLRSLTDGDKRMSESTLVVGQLFNGISVASILLLAALGLALSFGLMRVINMAHGEMLMMGGYLTYLSVSRLRQKCGLLRSDSSSRSSARRSSARCSKSR